MYLKKTELEQALRENMQSTLESYGGDSIAEDAICFCYDSMLAVIKQLGKDKREIMSEEELVLLLCIVQDDTRHQHGMFFLRNISTNCTRPAMTRMKATVCMKPSPRLSSSLLTG